MCCHPLNLCQSDRWECQYRISIVLTYTFFFCYGKSWTSLHMFICLCPFLLCVCELLGWSKSLFEFFQKMLWRKPEKTFWPTKYLCFAHFTLIYIISSGELINIFVILSHPIQEKRKFIFWCPFSCLSRVKC